MKRIATITDPRVVSAILRHLGLSARAPPISPARPAPEPEPDFWPDEPA